MNCAAHELWAFMRSLTEFFRSATSLLNSPEQLGAVGQGVDEVAARRPAATQAASRASSLHDDGRVALARGDELRAGERGDVDHAVDLAVDSGFDP
jgi:hypothetical protein